jgi:hypothetical protein
MRKWLFAVSTALLAMPALADWNPGDPYKMHYPQLPDPNGWDVNVTRAPGQLPVRMIADDFRCIESGPINDVHFWGSWRNDIKGQIEWIDLSFYSDDPVGPGGTDPTNNYSKPDKELWFQSFHAGEFTERLYGGGLQGWYDPFTVPPTVIPQNHQQIWQYNITNIPNISALHQEAGKLYWLAISVRLAPTVVTDFGWKTSMSQHFMDDAVYVDLPGTGATPWHELVDPITGQSLDMAFVITPEPVSVGLLVLAGAALPRRRRESV